MWHATLLVRQLLLCFQLSTARQELFGLRELMVHIKGNTVILVLF